MASKMTLIQALRLTHRYIGVFISPAVLFFAFTGALQTFSFHETTKGSSYKPPQLFVILGQIHKKQTPVVAVPKPPTPAVAKPEKKTDGVEAAPVPKPAQPPTAAQGPQHNPWPLKWFFLLVAISLFISTVSGIYMSYKFTREKWVVSLLLVLGTVIPVAMVLL